MIRSFDWRDLGLVHRLSEHGVCLDAEVALTRGPHALQSALLAFIAPGVGQPTFVWRSDADGGEAFAQMRCRAGEERAHLAFIAPGQLEDSARESLLEKICAEAAARGAHSLVAEVNEHSAEFEALRRFGFAIYTRQDIWRLTEPAVSPPEGAVSPRPQQSEDAIGIQALYANTVPRLIQQVEPPPARSRHGFVFEDSQEIVAFFEVSRGPRGIWIQPYLHPSIFDQRTALLAGVINSLAERGSTPVYVCARSHQDWLRTPLTELGFNAWAEQAVMVKRLAIHIGEPEFKPIPAIAAGKVTTQMIKSTISADTNPNA